MSKNYNKMKYFEKEEKIQANIYYHYTTLETLYNIVNSKTFWLTSLKSSNDKKELYYKPELFLEDLASIYAREMHENTKKCYKLIIDSIDMNKSAFMKECKEKTFPYALCLSKKKDNLTHWDRYAANCTGVCIAFNTSALRVLMQRLAITAFGIGVYDIEQVIYTAEQKEKYIKNAIANIIDALSRQKELDSRKITEIVRKDGYIYAASTYIQTAKFVKNNSFVDENEVRLYHNAASIKGMLRLMDSMKTEIDPRLYTNLKSHFEELVKGLQLDKEEFWVSTRGIRGYKKLCLQKVWGSGTIPEIILGPMCRQDKNELRRFLNANGLQGTKIVVSEVPVR